LTFTNKLSYSVNKLEDKRLLMSHRDEYIRRAKLVFEATKDLLDLEEIKKQCDILFCDWLKEADIPTGSQGTYYSDAKFNKMFSVIPLEQGKNAELVPKHDKDGNVIGHSLKHCALIKCNISNQQYQKRNTTTRVIDRLSDGGQEVDPDGYLEVASRLIVSDNPHEIASGLIAVTGRRPHEILWRGSFYPVEGEEHQLMFEGQGKKRGDKPVFKIGSLLPANYVIQRLADLRRVDSLEALFKEIESEFPDDREAQNRSLDSRRGNSLRRVVAREFGDKFSILPALNLRNNDDQNNCKALRAAYGCLATARDCRGSLGSKMLHFARLEGHYVKENPTDKDLRNLVTTLGYMDYYTEKPVPFAPVPTIEKVEKVMTTAPKKAQNPGTKAGVSPETLKIINELCDKENTRQAVIIDRWLEKVKKLEDVTAQLTAANEKINQLESKIKELESMSINEVQETTITVDTLESKFEARFKQLEELVLKSLQVSTISAPATVVDVVTPATEEEDIAKLEKVDTARERNLNTIFKGMANSALWEEKKSGVVEEKLNRSFAAMVEYNDNCSIQSDKIAITNIALSQLASANRQEVSKWIEANKECVIAHNKKHGMHTSKEDNNVVTYYNKGKKIDKALDAIKKSLKLDKPQDPAAAE
jgi:TolA-binding protein